MDLFETQKSHPELFKQFSLNGTLFFYYTCPQQEQILRLYSKHVQFNFNLSGKRIIKHGQNKWVSNPDRGLLLKKCAFLQELPAGYDERDVVVFYLKDDYLRAVFDEFQVNLDLDKLPEPNGEIIETFTIDEHIKMFYMGLVSYFRSKRPIPQSIFENKFKELLYNIFSHPENKHVLSYILRIAKGYHEPIWKVMEENFMYDLKVPDFANISNRSLATLKKEFRAY